VFNRKQLSAQNVFVCLANKLDLDGSWKGSTHAFIFHWLDQVQALEDPPIPTGKTL